MTRLKTAIYLAAILLFTTPVLPEVYGLLAEPPPDPLKTKEAPILDELRFTGLLRIAPAAVAAQIASHPGDHYDLRMIDKDVRALARLG